MPEPISWTTCITTCIAGLAAACAGPILAACSEEVFPRLKNFMTELLQSHRSNREPTTADLNLENKMNNGANSGGQKDTSQRITGQNSGGEKLAGQPSGGEASAGLSPRDKMKGVRMISASGLVITHSKKPEHWKWNEDPRFTKVAELLEVWYFHIKTNMNFLALSANTKYGAYLIFKIKEDSEGLDVIMNTSVSVGTKQDTKSVCLKPTRAIAEILGRPEERSDGWLELVLGQFDCDIVTDRDAVIIIKETKHMDIRKAGLVVAGIEIRPFN